MPKFPSLEWAKAYQKALNGREAYRNVSKGLTASFVFHVQAAETLASDHFMFVRLEDGKCVEVDEATADASPPADFVLRGSYAQWKKIVRGEVGPVEAFLTRKVQVQGSVARLLRYVPAAKELSNTTRLVETEFA